MSGDWMHGAVMPCPFCSVFAARSHQAKCNMRTVQCSDCGASVSAGSLHAHREMCPSAPVKCSGCGLIVQRDFLRMHLISCTARSFTCSDCGQAFWIAGEFLEHSTPSCRSRVVSCQLCGTPVATAQLAAHYADCSQRALRSSTNDGIAVAKKLTKTSDTTQPEAVSRLSSSSASLRRPITPSVATTSTTRTTAQRRSISPVTPLRANPAQLLRILSGEQAAPSTAWNRATSPRPVSPLVRHTKSGAYQSQSPPLASEPVAPRESSSHADKSKLGAPPPPEKQQSAQPGRALSRSTSGGSCTSRSKSPRLTADETRRLVDQKRANQSRLIRERELQQRIASARRSSDEIPLSFVPRQ